VVREGVAVTNRRASPRRPMPCDAWVSPDGRQRWNARLRDVSTGGFGLESCDGGPYPGQVVTLRAETLLPGLDLQAEILAMHPDGSVSCRFKELRPDMAAALAHLLGDEPRSAAA
jgi:hypothetical protein